MKHRRALAFSSLRMGHGEAVARPQQAAVGAPSGVLGANLWLRAKQDLTVSERLDPGETHDGRSCPVAHRPPKSSCHSHPQQGHSGSFF